MTKSDKKWPKVTNIPLNSDIFPPKMTIFPQFVNNIPKICRFTHFCRQNLASRIRTFVVESTSVPGFGGGGVKLILAMPVFWDHLLHPPFPYPQVMVFTLADGAVVMVVL